MDLCRQKYKNHSINLFAIKIYFLVQLSLDSEKCFNSDKYTKVFAFRVRIVSIVYRSSTEII